MHQYKTFLLSFLVKLSENIKKNTFLGPITLILTFLQSSKNVSISTLPVILSFMKFFVAQTSRTRFFFNCCKVKYLRH